MNNKLIFAKTDGTVSIMEVPNGKEAFAYSKSIIGCTVLEIVKVMPISKHGTVVMLLNENGYAELGDDIKNINKLGTWVYNGRKLSNPHYILGDITFALEVPGEDGDDIVPLTDAIAEILQHQFETEREEWAKIELPKSLDFPKPEIITFDSAEEFENFLKSRNK